MPNKDVEETSVDSKKREFIAKAGKYVVVGAGMATLMTPRASTAGNYDNTVNNDNNVNNGKGRRRRSWWSRLLSMLSSLK